MIGDMELETTIAFTDALVFAKAGVHLNDLQQAMLKASWSWQRQSYDQIAVAYGYSPTYLKHDVGPKLWKLLSEVLGEKVTKTSFRAAIERKFQTEGSVLPLSSSLPPVLDSMSSSPIQDTIASEVASTPTQALRQDWGEAVDVSLFYGRQQELEQLEQWITGNSGQAQSQRCRLVALLGMGGMGKTALSVKLAQRLTHPESTGSFEVLIWRSLRNAIPLEDLLTDLLQVLSNQKDSRFPDTTEGKIGQLLSHFRSHRCLVVLDSVETSLQETGEGETGDYGPLFRQVGEIVHQSCLLIASRKKPREIALLEGLTLPVRSLQLGGLSIEAGQELCNLKGAFQGSNSDWQQLIQGYSGNPLALKIISTTIQTLFDGKIANFLQQETLVFGTIRNLIEQQFDRLSTAEKTVMYWLAINREPTSLAELRSDTFPAMSGQALIEVLESLEHYSLVEKQAARFSLQSMVMEYVIDQLIAQVYQEIEAGFPPQKRLCKHHALMKATAKDYIRDLQARLILRPILERLLVDHSELSVLDRLLLLLSDLQDKAASATGYAAGNLLNLLFQKQSVLRDWNLSRLTIWQVNFQNISLQNVDFSDSDLSNSTFAEILGIVFTVAFSPDGTLLATGDAEGGLRLWQASDNKPLLNLAGHSGWVWSVAFSWDGSRLASCSSDKTIRLWDVHTGQCLQILEGHQGAIWSVAFSPSENVLASGGDEPVVRLWDTDTGNCIRTFSGHTGKILTVAFAKDQTLATGSEDGTIRLWNAQSGDCHYILQGHQDRIWSVAFSPDHRLLASGSADRTIKVWDVKTGNCLQTLGDHQDRIRSVTFSPIAQTLVSSSDDQTVRIWDVQTGECLSVLRGHTSTIFSVASNADNQTLASGSADQTVRFWQTSSGRCLKTLKGYTNSVFSIAFRPGGQQIASGSTDQTIRLWSNSPLEHPNHHAIFQGHQGWVTTVTFAPQEDLLASSSADQTVRLWSASTGKCVKILKGHSNWVQSVAFSPDGTLLASGGDDRTVRLWSVKTGQCLNLLEGHRSWIWSVAFNSTGILASSSDDQTIRIWSSQTGDCLQVLTGHTGPIQSISFSPDGKLLASGSGDETVRIWSVQTGNCLKVLSGHNNNVWSVAFSPDGVLVASGSLDQTVRLWDVAKGTCRQTLSVNNQSVRSSITFNPVMVEAGYRLATGSHGDIQIWNLSSGKILQTLIPDRPYQGTNISGVTGLTEAQKEALKALGTIEL